MENTTNTVIEEDSKVVIKRDYVRYRRASVRVCKDCGRFFVLSDSDAIHFVTKYGSLPLRCEDCRKKIREANPYPQEK